MKKQPQITEQTKNNIIKSFWELYKKNDISKITITNICKNANYDRTTFYRYFTDISDLLKQFEDEIIINIQNKIEQNKQKEKKANIILNKFEIFNNEYGEYIIVFHEKNNKNFHNKLKKIIKEDVFNYFNLNINDENKKELIFEFIFSNLINSYAYWHNHQNIMSLKSFILFANNIIANGIETIIKNK